MLWLAVITVAFVAVRWIVTTVTAFATSVAALLADVWATVVAFTVAAFWVTVTAAMWLAIAAVSVLVAVMAVRLVVAVSNRRIRRRSAPVVVSVVDRPVVSGGVFRLPAGELQPSLCEEPAVTVRELVEVNA